MFFLHFGLDKSQRSMVIENGFFRLVRWVWVLVLAAHTHRPIHSHHRARPGQVGGGGAGTFGMRYLAGLLFAVAHEYPTVGLNVLLPDGHNAPVCSIQ
jgi:hypothetical protein